MSKALVTCPCGHLVIERVDYIAPAYIVTFACSESSVLIDCCTRCTAPLFPLFRSGALRPINSATETPA